LVYRQRTAKQEALSEIALHSLKDLQLRRCLDPLSNGRNAEPMGKLDHRLAQSGIPAVAVTPGNVAAIDLELAEWNFAQLRQRAVAGAEIVDRKGHTQSAQLPCCVPGQRDVGENLILGDFEDQARPVV